MPGYSGSTFNDQIEKTYRRLQGNQRELIATCNANVLAGDTGIQLNGLAVTGIHAGAIIAVGTEVWLVESATIYLPTQTANIVVQRGYQGSTPAAYTTGQIVYLDPRFTRWDIACAINDALGYLSSPTYGLFQVVTNNITFNSVLRGYDMGVWPSGILKIVGINYDVPDASHYFPRIESYRLQRGISSTKIPSGTALFLNEGAWPGLAISVSAACPFAPLVNLTDDIVAVSGLDGGALDLLPLCAAIDVVIQQEFKRDELGVQTDPVKLQNVPPGATTNAVMALKVLRDERAAQEAARLALRWPEYTPG